ncbi:MAG: hypothetical protein GY807_23385 [Gammaproteobacteria bacterium]|nr:hypothetical protein [Gammaproteobacteria bacterium]
MLNFSSVTGFREGQAVQTIRKDAGGHFDPDMVAAFVELREDFLRIATEFANA